MKWFADLKAHAFASPVNNLLGTDANLALSAPMGKELDRMIAELNNKLTSLVNEHNKYASLALKWYSPGELGITNNDDIPDVASKTPQNSVVELWINDDSLFGRNIRKELSNLYPDFFGT